MSMIKKIYGSAKNVMATAMSKPMIGWSEHKIRGKQLGVLMPKKYPTLRQGTREFIKKYDEESKRIRAARNYK